MKDVIILGAGPIGLACGINALEHDLSYKIIEKGVLVNSIYHYPDKMTFFSSSEKLEIGGVPFVSHNPKPTRQEALEYYRRVAEKFELDINLYEEIRNIQKVNDHFQVKTAKGNYTCRNVVIASGFYDLANTMGVPGEDLPKVKHYYNDPHPYFRQKVAVIGAQNSAVDAALECWRKGAEVTMIIRGEELGKRVKYWVRPDIDNRIKEGSIKAYFNAKLIEITPAAIRIKHNGEEISIPNDYVLAMTGYKPDFELLQKTGIRIKQDDMQKPIYNPETMETSIERLYLAGVIVGGMETAKWFIENSRVHAEVIMAHIAEKQKAEA